MSEEEGRHVRRKRYRGNHPRAFSEKYKEHDPEKYAEDLRKVLARGDTPAGSHRSIMVEEILGVLAPARGDTAVDDVPSGEPGEPPAQAAPPVKDPGTDA